jgi:rubrerythrin
VLSAGAGAALRPIMAEIAKHETAHVALLQQTITQLGGTPVAKPTFDFTGGSGQTGANGRYGGPFADVFTNTQTFLALAQAFEDTGVRAYKGGAAALVSNIPVLEAALQIHSIEARHAAMVRRLRGEKGWVSGRASTLPAAAQPVYGPGADARAVPRRGQHPAGRRQHRHARRSVGAGRCDGGQRVVRRAAGRRDGAGDRGAVRPGLTGRRHPRSHRRRTPCPTGARRPPSMRATPVLRACGRE